MGRSIKERPSKILRGRVWWASIPHDKCNPHAQYGLRPIVIISNDQGNLHSPSLLVCPLTTQEDKYKFIHPNVMCGSTLSYVQCEQIKVLDKELLGQYIGQIRQVEQDYIDRALATAIDLSHYLNDYKQMKYKLEDANKSLATAQDQIKQLERKIADLEAENEQYNSSKDMFELGSHVKEIVHILSKSIDQPVFQPVMSIAQNNMETSEQLPSQPDDQASEPVNHSVEVEVSDLQGKPSATHTLSAVEKFNRRYEAYQKMQSTNTSTEDKPAEFSDRLGRPNATKWTNQRIRSFVADYISLSEEELLRKYDLRTFVTATKYYRKFMKHESL